MTARIKLLAIVLLLGLATASAFEQTGSPGSGGAGGTPDAESVDLDKLDMPGDYSAYDEVFAGWNTTSKQARPLGVTTTFYFEQSRESPRFVHSATNNPFVVDAATNPVYGLMSFSNSADKASNCGYFPMPAVRDYNTGIDLRLDEFRVVNGASSDSGDQVYEVGVATKVAGQTWLTAVYGSTVGVTMDSTLGTVAAEERALASVETLTGWKDVVASGVPWAVRVCRDGDDGDDTSTVDSRFSMLTIRAGNTVP